MSSCPSIETVSSRPEIASSRPSLRPALRFGRWCLVTAMLFAVPATPATAYAGVHLTVGEALEMAFPECEIVRRTVYLTEKQKSDADGLARVPTGSLIVYPYVAVQEGRIAGVAYFDSHIVRTLDETIMVAIDPNDRVKRVELLVFNEPPEYIPPDAWYRLFPGQRLDDRLAVNRGIRSVLGATLTTRSTTDAVRRVLAIHHVIKDQLEH